MKLTLFTVALLAACTSQVHAVQLGSTSTVEIDVTNSLDIAATTNL